jgi:2-methylcitrate dehydratase PrpD
LRVHQAAFHDGHWQSGNGNIRHIDSEDMTVTGQLAAFVVDADPPSEARMRAAAAVLDTAGVILAGAREPASRIVQAIVEAEGQGDCRVFGTNLIASATGAALANGVAAHALDFDDMCFVSLAHPSAALVPAAFAAAELAHASGAALLDAYVVGFEIEGRLGLIMNPRHYQRGWHCTSTLGSIGAAAAACRLMELDRNATGHALAIAASQASGLKENFGTMVKPLHAGLAARNGVLAALLARAGMTASSMAFEGPQGLLHAMDSETDGIGAAIEDLGARWEVLDTGITVKLYPSCAGTHPSLDLILDMRREYGFTAADVERIDIDVDAITPTVLLYDRPSSGLEAKFSMPFCAAAAIVDGRVGLETFEDAHLENPRIADMMERVRMTVDPAFDNGAPALTQARVTLRLRGGGIDSRSASGARGYPANPASDVELDAKFLSCAERALTKDSSRRALDLLRGIGDCADIRTLTVEMCRASRP